jgi:Domain of unknown function (DUF4349)
MARRTVVSIMAFLVLAGLVGVACGGRTGAGAGGGVAAPAKGAPGSGSTSGGAGSMGRDMAGPAPAPVERQPALAGPAPGAPAAVGPRIVKNASITLQVRNGTFDRLFQQATLVAGQAGGYVASSQTTQGGHRSGSLVVRVPVGAFEQALGRLKALGKVRSEDVSGQDVTSQYVDLQARLRNWEAQEAVLLGLMAKATSIPDSIRVQQQLQDVQLTIEELKGQLRVLGDQTDYATISVSMAEAGFVTPKPKERSGLAEAWHRALDGFVAVIAAIVVGLGYLLPIAVLILVLALIYRWVLRPRLAPAPPAAPAP